MTFSIIKGDCVEQMAAMAEASIDAIVCDPPYHLAFMGKAWDTVIPGESQREHECWAREALRVLKPGGHLLAFGGTRTYHRLAAGIEDASFEIRDTICWLYGSGFPKSLDVSKAIDRAAEAQEAERWEGWGTALKPSHEPIVVARKPLSGTVAQTVLAHGTGGLNIAACRIPHVSADAGRWPSNVVLDERAAALLDAQTGELTSGVMRSTAERGARSMYGQGNGRPTDVDTYGDSGGASRFFYCAKASSAERNAGLEGFGKSMPHDHSSHATARANAHPTVKPIALMCWLVRLVTPPGGIVLDPFTGSGTTGIAALREGFSFIGIERDPDYVSIARARIIGDAPLLNQAAEET